MKKIIIIITLLLSSSAFAFHFASPKDPSGKIIMNQPKTTQQIFPVKLLTVNGKNVNSRSNAAWLAPGEYELGFGATVVDMKYTTQRITRQRHDNSKNMKLKLTVEADKSYYLGFDASDSNPKNWKAVAYDVK